MKHFNNPSLLLRCLVLVTFSFLITCPQALGQKDYEFPELDTTVAAHFLMIWPKKYKRIKWEVLRDNVPPDCEHYMNESNVGGVTDCTEDIIYKKKTFQHFDAKIPGIYYFLGVRRDKVKLSAVYRLGEDVLANWSDLKATDSLPAVILNFHLNRYLAYPFCEDEE